MKPIHSQVSYLLILCLLILVSMSGTALSQDSHSHEGSENEPLSAELRRMIVDVRHKTAVFRDFEGIEDAGYVKFLDCFVNDKIGAMGQHYVNGDLAGDDVLDPFQPEALVYEPSEDGEMILVAFEYLVFADVWDPNDEGRGAPVLFDQEFHLKTNIPDTPPVWTLHIWLWTHNPDGLFADYNTVVACPDDYPITDMTP